MRNHIGLTPEEFGERLSRMQQELQEKEKKKKIEEDVNKVAKMLVNAGISVEENKIKESDIYQKPLILKNLN